MEGALVVLPAVARLLNDPDLHDVEFLCTADNVLVGANRAYLCASSDYFDKLLRCQGFREAGKDRILVQTSSQAFKSVLHYLFTGQLPAAFGDDCRRDTTSLAMATACLAQQYLLPSIVSFIAARVLTDVRPEAFGQVLSQALQADLQPVLRNLWLAAARRLPQPLMFDGSFSADAIRFCLQHTAWINNNNSSSNKGSPGPAAAPNAAGPAANGTSTNAFTDSSSNGMERAASSCFGQETAAFSAVLAWFLAHVEDCPDCQSSRHHSSSCVANDDTHSNSSISNDNGSVSNNNSGMAVPILSKPPVHKQQGGLLEPSDSCSSLLLRGIGHHTSSQQQQQCPCLSRSSGSSASACDDQAAPWGSSRSSSSSSSSCCSSITLSPAASSESCISVSSTAITTSSGDSSTLESPCCTGECCVLHQRVLLQLLGSLSWHLLGPSASEQLEALGLLGTRALLALYRAQQRCSHLALQGCFVSVSLAGGQGGLRCLNWEGEQVLECDSASHLTACTSFSFTSGRHAWQIVVHKLCDLTWVGLGDSPLQPEGWGGKQEGGYFYGSNDALCNARNGDKHAYASQCAFGAWRDVAAAGGGAAGGEAPVVVDVMLDMDAREVWFAVDGAEPRLGFSGLPGRVYPAVSVRAPARLAVRFRQGCLAAAECWQLG